MYLFWARSPYQVPLVGAGKPFPSSSCQGLKPSASCSSNPGSLLAKGASPPTPPRAPRSRLQQVPGAERGKEKNVEGEEKLWAEQI